MTHDEDYVTWFPHLQRGDDFDQYNTLNIWCIFSPDEDIGCQPKVIGHKKIISFIF